MLRRFKKQDEAETLFKSFDASQKEADQNFKKLLRADILAYNQKQNNNSSFNLTQFLRSFFNMDNQFYRPIKIVAGISMSVLLLAISVGFGYKYFQNKGTKVTTLSDSEKQEVFIKLLAQNPSSVIKESNEESLSLSSQVCTAEMNQDQAQSLYYNPEYNYSHYVTINTIGPKNSECGFYPSQGGKNEHFEYSSMNEDEKTYIFYSKNLDYDENGNLNYYYLNTPTKYIEYHGGEYAISGKSGNGGIPILLDSDSGKEEEAGDSVEGQKELSIFNEMSKGTEESLESGQGNSDSSGSVNENGEDSEEITLEKEEEVNNVIDSLFGDNAKVEEVKENGVLKYYIVTSSYYASCGEDPSISDYLDSYEEMDKTISNNKEENNIISKTWYDAETFQIFKTETYLESEKAENLISRSEIEMEMTKVDFEEVADKFDFEYAVEIKEVPEEDYINYPYDGNEVSQNKYLQEVKNFLNEGSITLTMPLNSKYELSEISPNKQSSVNSYYLDRKFYAAGEQGQKMYDEAQVVYNDFYGKFQVLGITYLDEDAIINDSQGEDIPVLTEDANSNYSFFSNIVVKAEVTEEDLLNNIMYGASFEKTVNIMVNGQNVEARKYILNNQEDSTDYSLSYLVFEYGNFKHIYYLETQDNEEMPTTYTALMPNNSEDWGKIEAKIRNSFALHVQTDTDYNEPEKVEPSGGADY